MGENVEFPSDGGSDQGYLATPHAGGGPGVIVIQEWWGLVDHIRDVCDRFAGEGFLALAPDLYHGRTTTEPDEAAKMAMALELEQAGRDLSGAVDFLQGRASGPGLAVVGFCMGGGLALLLATQRADAIRATVPFYGVIPGSDINPDWSKLSGPVQGHYATDDDFAGPPAVAKLERALGEAGKECQMFVYPKTHHAFFNDTRPDVYDAQAAGQAWERTIAFLRQRLA